MTSRLGNKPRDHECWARMIGVRLTTLWEMLLAEAKARGWLQIDETRVQVPQRGGQNKPKSLVHVGRSGGPVEKVDYPLQI